MQSLKEEVARYWNQAACGTDRALQSKFSREYFEEIEEHRYTVEPEIFSFAQFTRYAGQKILEVGVGAGTDFTQWVRAGAQAHGIDLTQEAIDHVQHRLNVYGLRAAEVKRADAENLPYPPNTFDLVYSWGVIHHSPNTQKCLEEIVRVTKPGGRIKIMIYHRYSLVVLYRYLKSAVKGKLFRSFSDVLFYDVESLGTKGYSFKEVRAMCQHLPIQILEMKATVTSHDLLKVKSKWARRMAYFAALCLGWNRAGFYLTLDLKKH